MPQFLRLQSPRPASHRLNRRSRTRSSRERQRAQAVVEFALIIPVFILLLLMAVDFGRFFFTYIQLNNSAREAVAYAAFNPTTDNASLATIARREANVQGQRGEGAITATSSCVDDAGIAVACVDATGGAGAGNRITVRLNGTFTFLTPLIGMFWSGGLPVSTSATAAVVDYASGGGGAPPRPVRPQPPTPTFSWQSPDPTNHPYLISVNAEHRRVLPAPARPWATTGTLAARASTRPNSDQLQKVITQDYEYAGARHLRRHVGGVECCGGQHPFSTTISLGTTPCSVPVATSRSRRPGTPNNTNPTNWFYYQNNTYPGTASTLTAAPARSCPTRPVHPTWDWNFAWS